MSTLIVLLAACGLLAAVARLLARRSRALRGSRAPGEIPAGSAVETVHEAAFLAGGPARVADTVLCAMVEKDRILIDDRTVLVVTPVADDDMERAVLDLCGTWEARLPDIRAGLAASAPVQEVGDALAARGLLWRPEHHGPWRSAVLLTVVAAPAALLLSLAVLLFSGAPAAMALAAGAVAAFVLGLALGPGRSRLTAPGRAALADLEADPRWAAAGLAGLVALGGTAALTDLVLREQFATAGVAAASGNAAASTTWGAACGALPAVDTGNDRGGGGCGSGGSGGDGGSGCGGGGCGGGCGGG
ncbi:TIGR04222 domain-containing membrane protein [Streptomyces sp. DSM 44917]|uniref:TIGR04222 domain-containing membrane protein n=1 Tax=Streptomyces boetiae TaxID=3075541 RepID=A0ABU2L2D2_9ACTN|nr:TIGR04222 domain-containing membrane protein [Streptomyces sp. DSM 44917]MDT0305714.1 TIGR04222 domain-containing membrane protein [Streptomyces sp. DSM 44917]